MVDIILQAFHSLVDAVYFLNGGFINSLFGHGEYALAIDPITIGLLAGTAAKGIGSAIAGRQAKKAGQRERKLGRKAMNRALERFESGELDLRMSQDVRDAAEQRKQYAEAATQRAETRGAAQQQAMLGALRTGDRRLAGTLPQMTQRLERGIQDAEMRGLGEMVSADSAVAAEAQRISDANQTLKQQLRGMQLARGAARFDAGRADQAAGRQAITSGIFDVLGAGAQFAGMGGFGSGGAGGASGAGGAGGATGSGASVDANFGNPSGGSGMGALQYQQNLQDELLGNNQQGGYVGRKGGVTEGEFSHEDNPIDMINEEGEKVGEVTGGEMVFNPKQTSAIEALVAKGDGDMLIKFMRELLSQPQFQK
jgi:hypothetical protein